MYSAIILLQYLINFYVCELLCSQSTIDFRQSQWIPRSMSLFCTLPINSGKCFHFKKAMIYLHMLSEGGGLISLLYSNERYSLSFKFFIKRFQYLCMKVLFIIGICSIVVVIFGRIGMTWLGCCRRR